MWQRNYLVIMLNYQEIGSRKMDSSKSGGSSSVTKKYKVSGNRVNFVLAELEPATYYDLKLIANNSAGSSQTKYTFATHTITGGKSFLQLTVFVFILIVADFWGFLFFKLF